VAAYAAFMYAQFVPGYSPLASAANLTTGANLTSWKQWVAGLQFGFAGFTLGGSVGYDNNGMGANYYTGVDNDSRWLSGGIMYETGPWQLSAAWVGVINTNGNGSLSIGSITPGTSAANLNLPGSTSAAFTSNGNTGGLVFGNETAQKFEFGANYALGPGIKMTGGFLYQTANGPTNAVVGQSWAALIGMDFRF